MMHTTVALLGILGILCWIVWFLRERKRRRDNYACIWNDRKQSIDLP